jgi:chromosome segregation ATPase
MSRLTVTEKEHWKSRIERRIDKAIDAIEAKDPSLKPTIEEKAEELAHESLGTAEYQRKIEAIKKRQESMEAELSNLQDAIYQRAFGDTTKQRNSYLSSIDFKKLHRKQRERFEEELLSQSDHGQAILKLRREKESLLDTVWLATSSKQIADLWNRVSIVVQDELTPLQEAIVTQRSEPDND